MVLLLNAKQILMLCINTRLYGSDRPDRSDRSDGCHGCNGRCRYRRCHGCYGCDRCDRCDRRNGSHGHSRDHRRRHRYDGNARLCRDGHQRGYDERRSV